MEVHHPVFYVSLGHMQNNMRSSVTLKLKLTLTLTLTPQVIRRLQLVLNAAAASLVVGAGKLSLTSSRRSFVIVLRSRLAASLSSTAPSERLTLNWPAETPRTCLLDLFLLSLLYYSSSCNPKPTRSTFILTSSSIWSGVVPTSSSISTC